MKKLFALLLTAALILSLAACSSDAGKGFSKQNSVSDVLNNGGATEVPAETATAADTAVKTPSPDVDIDLTALSSQMVYSEVLNMINNPDSYKGKSVRMAGDFNMAEYNGKNYYACMVNDATACCANGIEFRWKGDHTYPDDYPAIGDPITVDGDFDFYYEGESRYIQLINAEVSF